MKKIVSIFSFLAASLLLFGGCEQEVDRGTLDSSIDLGVGFLQKTLTSEVDREVESPAVTVMIARSISTAEQTFDITVSEVNTDNLSALIEIPSSVTFPAGEKALNLKLPVHADKLEPGQVYSFVWTIQSDTENLILHKSVTVYFTMKLNWIFYGNGTYTYPPLLSWGSYPQTLEIAEGLNYYRMPDLYSNGTYIKFFVAEDGTINVPYQPTGLTTSGMEVWIITHPEAAGPSVRNGNTFTFYNLYWVPDAGGGFSSNNPETLVLD